jgi:hypothetical protein
VIYLRNFKNPWLLLQTAGIITVGLIVSSFLLPFEELRWMGSSEPFICRFGYHTSLIFLLPLLLFFIAYGLKSKKGEYLLISGLIGIVGVWRYTLYHLHCFMRAPEERYTFGIGLNFLVVSIFCTVVIGFLMCMTSEKGGLRGIASTEQVLLSVMLANTVAVIIYLVIDGFFLSSFCSSNLTGWIIFFILLIFEMPGILLIALLPIRQAISRLSLKAAYLYTIIGIGTPVLLGVWFSEFVGYSVFLDSTFSYFIVIYFNLSLLVLLWSVLVALWILFIKKFFFPNSNHSKV